MRKLKELLRRETRLKLKFYSRENRTVKDIVKEVEGLKNLYPNLKVEIEIEEV